MMILGCNLFIYSVLLRCFKICIDIHEYGNKLNNIFDHRKKSLSLP